MGSRPAGFTLVELLVAITVIGILSAMALGGMYRADSAAKRTNTKTTVAKVSAQVSEIWESYRNRKLPVDPKQVLTSGGSLPYQYQYPGAIGWLTYFSQVRAASGIPSGADPINMLPANPLFPNNIQVAAIRLAATRELIRLEMPCRFADFTSSTSGSPANAAPVKTLLIPQPVNAGGAPLANPGGLSEQYRQFFIAHATTFNSDYESAECLYMVVKFASQNDLGQKSITDDPRLVGDADGDGMPEIQDAFLASTFTPVPAGSPYTRHNMPISFIRWPAGYISDLQPGPTLAQYGNLSSPPPSWTYTYEYASGRHDIYDPLRIDPRAFTLSPLVFSAGATGSAVSPYSDYDIWEGHSYTGLTVTQKLFAINDPYFTDGAPASAAPLFPVQSNLQDPLPGALMDVGTTWPNGSMGSGAYGDNITNHLLSARSE